MKYHPVLRSLFPGCMCAIVLVNCSLVNKRSQPDPKAENVHCVLEYQPLPPGKTGTDLLFLAWSMPFQEESFMLSLPDVLVHGAFQPGRHLTERLRVEGADCAQRAWRKGAVLPRRPAQRGKVIVCSRRHLEAVVFEVMTKWGSCRAEIPAEDVTPRPIEPRSRELWKLPSLGS